MHSSIRQAPPYTHAMIAFGVFLGVMALANGPLRGTLLGFSASETVEIGVEHVGSASITLEMSTLQGSALVDLTNTTQDETIAISVPTTWERREVRNASLAEVSQEPPNFGFTRWSLPPNAVISFKVLAPPQEILMHNPTEAPLMVRLTRIDLDTEEVEHDVVLIQESAVELW